VAAVLLLNVGFNLTLQAETTPSGLEIVQKVVRRAAEIEEQNPQAEYTYNQLSVRMKLDSDGTVKERDEKLYEVFYIEGLPFRRLVKRNGQPLSAEEVNLEQQREQNFHLQVPERKRRKAQGPLAERISLNEELVSRYSFDLLGREAINGRSTYVLAYRPQRDDLPVRRRLDRLLNKLTGKVWIDEQDNEIVRLEGHLAEKVTLWGGLIATVRKLEGEFEQTRTDEGVWFPLRIQGSLDARYFFTNVRFAQTERWSDFRKVGNHNSADQAGTP
jgi:hypothetical protein